jgi:hypothetical protein
MNNSWDHLKRAREILAGLKKIMADADPASGVSFAVRRGVARDNEAVEGDEDKRPWVTLELSDLKLSEMAIKILIDGALSSIEFWSLATQRDIDTAGKELRNI